MSFEDGWAALNLEMPKRVPRTEYSAEFHWELIRAVTAIDIRSDSQEDLQSTAAGAFVRAWNYDLIWATPVKVDFGKWETSMGHAVYMDGGVDYDNRISCPFHSPEEVLAFDPLVSLPHKDKSEIIAHAEARYAKDCAANPTVVNMTGIYNTCMSGLIQMLGWDMLLMTAGLAPEEFGRFTNRYCQWIGRYFEAVAETKIPVVMIHDDIVWMSGAFLHPEWYKRFVFPNYKRFFAPLIESGKKILFTSDGNYTEFIDDVAACGVDGFVLEPATDMKYIADKYGATHAMIGNADTRILLSGPKSAIRAEVERCMSIGKRCPGFFMAVGNHIPPNTPVENALYYNDVYLELSVR